MVIASRDSARGPAAPRRAPPPPAVLLELAEVLGGTEHAKTLVFVSTDGCSDGAAGAREFARRRSTTRPDRRRRSSIEPARRRRARPAARRSATRPADDSASMQLVATAEEAVAEQTDRRAPARGVLRRSSPGSRCRAALGEQAVLIEEGLDAVAISLRGRAAARRPPTTLGRLRRRRPGPVRPRGAGADPRPRRVDRRSSTAPTPTCDSRGTCSRAGRWRCSRSRSSCRRPSPRSTAVARAARGGPARSAALTLGARAGAAARRGAVLVYPAAGLARGRARARRFRSTRAASSRLGVGERRLLLICARARRRAAYLLGRPAPAAAQVHARGAGAGARERPPSSAVLGPLAAQPVSGSVLASGRSCLAARRARSGPRPAGRWRRWPGFALVPALLGASILGLGRGRRAVGHRADGHRRPDLAPHAARGCLLAGTVVGMLVARLAAAARRTNDLRGIRVGPQGPWGR